MHPTALHILMDFFSRMKKTIQEYAAIDNETFLVQCGSEFFVGHINAYDVGYEVEIEYQLS